MEFDNISLVGAFILGAIHALEPGHGKSIVAAYLIGSKGTVKDAFVLGITITLTHTFTVIMLGILATLATSYYIHDKIEHLLELSAGIIVIGIGIWMLIRARSILGTINPSSSNFSENRHKHLSNENQKISNKSLISLGLAGGIVPCPAALAIIILAVSKGAILPGLAVVLSLSIGLGVTLVGIGILICKTSSSLLNNFDSESRIIKIMPLISGLIVTILGIIITVRALFY